MATELTKPTGPQIMVVDDSKVVRWSISKILGEKYTVHAVESAESAWEMLQAEKEIALVFCDLQMPGMDGYQFLRQVRGSDDARLINLPIIIISGEEDADDLREQILQQGATDFVLKPFDPSLLRSRVAAYVSYQHQIMKLEQDVELDPISGLAGRNYFQVHAERNLTLATRHNIEFTLAVLELDRYQELLDKLGNKVFFQLLFQVGKRIKKIIRVEDLAARIDQARFGLVLPLTNAVGGRLAIERICEDLDRMSLKYAGERIKVSISAGMTVFNVGCMLSTCGLIGRAEQALIQARSSGGNCVVSYEQLESKKDTETEQVTTWIASDPSIDLIRDIQSGNIHKVSDRQLRQLLSDIRPVLELADLRLNTGFGELLMQVLKNQESETED